MGTPTLGCAPLDEMCDRVDVGRQITISVSIIRFVKQSRGAYCFYYPFDIIRSCIVFLFIGVRSANRIALRRGKLEILRHREPRIIRSPGPQLAQLRLRPAEPALFRAGMGQ